MSPDNNEHGDHGEGGVPFLPDHFVKELAVITLIMGVLVFLATLMPAPVGLPADPLKTPAGIKPEWYFLSVYQILKYVPKNVGIAWSFLIFPPILIIFPFFYRQYTRFKYGRLILHTIGALGVLFAVFLAFLAYLGFE